MTKLVRVRRGQEADFQQETTGLRASDEVNGCVQVTWDPIILWLELARASIFHYVLWTSFKGFYSQQVEGLRVEAFWIPLLAISNDLARLWSHVMALMEGPRVAQGWKWKTVATLVLIAVRFYELNSQCVTLISSVFLATHHHFSFFFFFLIHTARILNDLLFLSAYTKFTLPSLYLKMSHGEL